MQRGSEAAGSARTRRRRRAPPTRFASTGASTVPDPAARANPTTCTAPSRLVDPRAYAWQRRGWRGRPWHEAVIYELHVGTFTPSGTFRAARRQARSPRGARRDLRRAHAGRRIRRHARLGLRRRVVVRARIARTARPTTSRRSSTRRTRAVSACCSTSSTTTSAPKAISCTSYAPEFFNRRHHTPWGAAINYDGDRQPHRAGIRDPQRALLARGISLRRSAARCRARARATTRRRTCSSSSRAAYAPARAASATCIWCSRTIFNQATLLGAPGDPERFDAQWNDDFHHCAARAAHGRG